MIPARCLTRRAPPETIHAFIELHIEQGPVLAHHREQIGIVTGISGVFKWLVRLVGKAAHAGTAPMDLRSDAFLGLADFAHEIPRIIDEDGSDASRLTIGMVELKPGYPHTVPGEVDFSLVGRDIDPPVMENLALSCRKVLSTIARRHRLHFDFEQLSWLDPQRCDDEIIAAFRRQAETLGLRHRLMPSGAGHDTQFMAQISPRRDDLRPLGGRHQPRPRRMDLLERRRDRRQPAAPHPVGAGQLSATEERDNV